MPLRAGAFKALAYTVLLLGLGHQDTSLTAPSYVTSAVCRCQRMAVRTEQSEILQTVVVVLTVDVIEL